MRPVHFAKTYEGRDAESECVAVVRLSFQDLLHPCKTLAGRCLRPLLVAEFFIDLERHARSPHVSNIGFRRCR